MVRATRLAREHRRDTTSAGKSNDILCQNCIRCPLKPRSNTVICGDTLMHTVVAGSRWSGVRWCVSVCVSTRGRNLFPSVRLQPLGHLSDWVESTAYRKAASPAKANC